jgi:hypothetical protein
MAVICKQSLPLFRIVAVLVMVARAGFEAPRTASPKAGGSMIAHKPDGRGPEVLWPNPVFGWLIMRLAAVTCAPTAPVRFETVSGPGRTTSPVSLRSMLRRWTSFGVPGRTEDQKQVLAARARRQLRQRDCRTDKGLRVDLVDAGSGAADGEVDDEHVAILDTGVIVDFQQCDKAIGAEQQAPDIAVKEDGVREGAVSHCNRPRDSHAGVRGDSRNRNLARIGVGGRKNLKRKIAVGQIETSHVDPYLATLGSMAMT